MQLCVVGKGTLNFTELKPGEELFYRFVFGCISARRGPLRKPDTDLDELERLFKERIQIPHSLFYRQFPDAVTKLGAFIYNPLAEEPWSFDAVLASIKAHIGPVPSCNTFRDVVIEVKDKGRFLVVQRKGKEAFLSNDFKLKVVCGDTVLSHKSIVVVVLPVEAS